MSTTYRAVSQSYRSFMIKRGFKTIVEKGENPGNHHFLLSQHLFSYVSKKSTFKINQNLLSASFINLDVSFCRHVKS